MNRLRLTAVAALAVLSLGTASAAQGYFASPSAGGRGAVAVPSLSGVAVSAGAVGTGLRPGGSATLTLTATNSNPRAVRIEAIRLDGVGAITSDAPACVDPAVTVTTQTNGGAGWVVPARAGGIDGSLRIELPGAVGMGQAADSGCQGATLTIRLAVGA